MHLRSLCRALAIVVCVPMAAPAWGAGDAADPPPPPAPAEAAAAVGAAQALIDAGRFEEAVVALRPLLGQEPVGADVLFLYGLASLEASRRPGRVGEDREILLDEAIAAFRAMLIEAPGLVRVRLELARAFFLKGEDSLARRHFEHVLAGRPPAEVVRNVTRFLAEIRARRRWSFHVGAALAPDTNIGAASDARTIVIYGLPFQRDAEELTTSGVGVSVWGGGEYQHPARRARAPASRRRRPAPRVRRRRTSTRRIFRCTPGRACWPGGTSRRASSPAPASAGWAASPTTARPACGWRRRGASGGV